MLKKTTAIALVGTAFGCATFAELVASNGEEFKIKYSLEIKQMTPADGEYLGFQREKKNGKYLDFAVLGASNDSSQNTFKVKGDKNRKGFRIRSTDDAQIFSYNQGLFNLIEGGYYMWRVDETNDHHKLDFYTRFVFDDKKQSLKSKLDAGNENPLAMKESKKTGTQIYKKLMYNGMKNTRFCFIAHHEKKKTTEESDKTKVQNSNDNNKVNKPDKTEEGNDNEQERKNEHEKTAVKIIEVSEEKSAAVSVAHYKRIGNGWCRPKGCDLRNINCRVNGFYKDSMSNKNCKSECDADGECRAYASSNQYFTVAPRRCFLYGPMLGKRPGWTQFAQRETVTQRTNGAKHVECFVNNEFYTHDSAVEWSAVVALVCSFIMY